MGWSRQAVTSRALRRHINPYFVFPRAGGALLFGPAGARWAEHSCRGGGHPVQLANRLQRAERAHDVAIYAWGRRTERERGLLLVRSQTHDAEPYLVIEGFADGAKYQAIYRWVRDTGWLLEDVALAYLIDGDDRGRW